MLSRDLSGIYILFSSIRNDIITRYTTFSSEWQGFESVVVLNGDTCLKKLRMERLAVSIENCLSLSESDGGSSSSACLNGRTEMLHFRVPDHMPHSLPSSSKSDASNGILFLPWS